MSKESLVDRLWGFVPLALVVIALLWIYIFTRVILRAKGVEW